MRRHVPVLAITVGLSVSVGLSGCLGLPQEPTPFCQDGVTRIEIYNTFADHEIADYQDIDDAETVDYLCNWVWRYDQGLDSGSNRDLEDARTRGTTAVVMHDADGGTRTIWFYRTEGFTTDDVILFDTGEIYTITAHTLIYYGAPSSEIIDRNDMPQP